MIVRQACRPPAYFKRMVRYMEDFHHGRISVVVGGQFGSEGKGAVAGWIGRPAANEGREVLGVRVGGPNAGHTVYGKCPFVESGAAAEAQVRGCSKDNEFGHPWALRQVPVVAVTNPDAGLVIAAGSEVDIDVLMAEVMELDAAGYCASGRLVVDRAATVLSESHRVIEAGKDLQRRLGSTAKGIGAARADRIFREARTVGDCEAFTIGVLDKVDLGPTVDLMERVLAEGGHVVIEGTQGYGLGLHTDYYPFVTSGDCRAIDFLSQAGISPWGRFSPLYDSGPDLKVVVCFRPYPIRVAGNSGPMEGETSWSELGLNPEFTTVTHKMRRVGDWDPTLVDAAVRANGGVGPNMVLALTMGDHLIPALAGKTSWHELDSYTDKDLYNWIRASELTTEVQDAFWRGLGTGLALVGTGPTTMLGDLEN